MYFNLKERNSNKDTLIILRYYISKKEGRFVYSTGLHIHPDDWDHENKMPKLKRGNSKLKSVYRSLQKFVDLLDKTLNHLALNEIPVTREFLKSAFDQEFKGSDSTRHVYFLDFLNQFIENAPSLVNRSTKKKYSPTKIKHYKKTKNRFSEFEKAIGKKIKLDGFSISVYDQFVDFMLHERNYAVNTVGENVKNIKVFLKKAEEFGYEVHKDYKSSSFTVLKEDSVSIALNEEEIEMLFSYDFSNNEKLQNTRDLAIIGLWTGLRVSDFLSLPEIKSEDKFITVQPKKTKDSSGIKVVIPLHHQIKEIIETRGMPRMISDVKFNEYIKEVCKEVGFTQMVKGSLMVKGENGIYRKKVGFYEKYKLVSSHTCRRSFATNLYKMNFPTLSIMQITGHKTEKSFLTYIKVTPTEHAEKLLKHWEDYYSRKS